MSKATIPVTTERLDINFAAGTFDAPHGFILANGKLWACAQMIPCRILRLDLDMVTNAIVSAAADGQHDRGLDLIYDPNINGEIFVLHRNTDRTVITRVDVTTMGLSDAANDTNHPNTNGSLANTITHLFCGTFFGTIGDSGAPDAQVIKWDLDDFTSKTVLNLTNLKQCHCIRYDGTNLYATGSASSSSQPWIAKINPTTLAFTSALIPAALGYPTDDLAFYGDYVYVGMELANAGTILKVAKSDLSIAQITTRPATANFYGIFADATHLWALTTLGEAGGRGRMIRIDPSTLEQRLYSFNAGTDEGSVAADGPNEMAFNSPYMYVTFFQSGTKISRLRIPTT